VRLYLEIPNTKSLVELLNQISSPSTAKTTKRTKKAKNQTTNKKKTKALEI
jgi:hypothetical protein